MRRLRHLRFSLLAALALVVAPLAGVLDAQDNDDQQRGVGRISLMNGDVSVKRGDAGEWVAGVINAPLLTDDRVSTAPNSRVEIQFDSSNLLRMGGMAEIHLAQVEYGRYQIELAHGTLTYVVIRPSVASVEVDTPSVSVRPSKQGIYRITVNEAGETEVAVRSGEVEVFTPRGSQWISAGQMMVARGNTADPEFQIVNARPLDEWDRWNQTRDRQLQQSSSYQYVPQGVYGAEDLDSYGSWVSVPDYGYVWRPTVAVGWAPYRLGRWVWEDWYGWTWVSYDPWGWAPYHYGRWFWDGGFGWCWYPGRIGVRHYWSPALVAWFGFGGHVGVGFGFGHVGWVPLAPYEVFHPWWGRGFYGRGFNERINITNVNITNVYRNARVGNGISGVAAGDFQGGRFHNISGFTGSQVREAGLVRGQVPLAPSNAHLNFTGRAAGYVPRSTSPNTHYFSRNPVATPQRIPFSQQQRALNGGGNFGTRPEAGRAPAQSPVANRPQAAPNAGAQNGWRRFGDTPGQSQQAQRPAMQNTRPPSASPAPSGQAPQNRGGWQRFGAPGGSAPRPQPQQAQPQPAPRQNYQGSSGFGSPRYSAPPSRSYSPPPSRGGGGGGGSRPSGGGGGGSRPSGGGGGSHSGGRR